MGNKQSYVCAAEDNVELWEQTLVNVAQSAFSDEGLQRLAQHLSSNKHSRALLLDQCNISDEASLPIINALRKNSSLLYLSFSGNNIGKEGAEELLDVLEQNNALFWLDISQNPLFPEATSMKIAQLLAERRDKAQLASVQPSLIAPISINNLRNNSPKTGKPVRILSLDGGGVRLLAQIAALQHLEAQTGKQIADLFDLICATGLSSLIAVSLMSKRFSLAQCRDVVMQIVQKVLHHQNLTNEWSESLWNSGWYDVATLEAILGSVFGADAKLQSPQASPKVCLVSCPQSPTESSARVVLLRSYVCAQPELAKTYSHKKSVDCSIVEAIRACSATRGFFAPKQIGAHLFIDGSDIAPNPSEIAYHEAAMLFPDSPIALLLSLGSGMRHASQHSTTLAGAYQLTARYQIAAENTHRRVCDWLAAIDPHLTYTRLNFPPTLGEIHIDARTSEAIGVLESASIIADSISKYSSNWNKMIENIPSA